MSLTVLVVATITFINYLNESRDSEALARKAAEANEHAAELAKLEAQMNFKRYIKEKEITDLSLMSNGRIIHDLRVGFYKKVLQDPQKEVDDIISTLDRIGTVSKNVGYYNFLVGCTLFVKNLT